MLRKSVCALAVAAGALMTASQADAAFFSFVDFANNVATGTGPKGEGNVGTSGNVLTGGNIFTVDGVSVRATATNSSTGTGTPPWPYLDAGFGNLIGGSQNAAGLGVCQNGSTVQGCAGSTDDNIDNGFIGGNMEILSLEFTSGPQDITQLIFRDADHEDDFPDAGGAPSILIQVNGGGFSAYVLANDFFPANPKSSFTGVTKIDFKFNNDGEFYLSAMNAVPIPAALPLFATALAGLGIFGWRRRKTGTA